MVQLFLNNFEAVIDSWNPGAPEIFTLVSGGESLVGLDGSGDSYYIATIRNNSNDVLEIIKIIDVAGQVITTVRGQEGTNGTAARSAGEIISMRVTAGTLNTIYENFSRILTDGESVLIGDDGNVLYE